jgi:hypothetical protein
MQHCVDQVFLPRATVSSLTVCSKTGSICQARLQIIWSCDLLVRLVWSFACLFFPLRTWITKLIKLFNPTTNCTRPPSAVLI